MTAPGPGGLASAIYDGRVRHRRFEPFERRFEYRLHMLYLDLDELPEVTSINPLWSTRRRAPACLRRADYLGDPDRPLGDEVRDLVEGRTGHRPDGPVRLLTNPRQWGVIANPVSFYYCFDREGKEIEAVVAEVTNTPWRQRHSYVIAGDAGPVVSGSAGKALHVSPLMAMDHRYELRFGRPGRSLSAHIESRRGDALHFDATLNLRRRELSPGLLGRLLLTRPPIPVTVFGGIYLQAALTWMRGAQFHARPAGKDLPNRPPAEMLCPMRHDRHTAAAPPERAA